MQRWQAFIKRGGKSRYLGTFLTAGEATAARKAAEIELGYHPNHGQPHKFANHFIPKRDRLCLETNQCAETGGRF